MTSVLGLALLLHTMAGCSRCIPGSVTNTGYSRPYRSAAIRDNTLKSKLQFFRLYGRSRAIEDLQRGTLYGSYDFKWVLLAQSEHTETYRRISRLYFRGDANHRRLYLKAFKSGYQEVLKENGHSLDMPQVPVLNKLIIEIVFEITYDGMYPTIRNKKELTAFVHHRLAPEDALKFDKIASTIEFNYALSGKSVRNTPRLKETIILYQIAPDKDGKYMVVYASGNTASITKSDFEAVELGL